MMLTWKVHKWEMKIMVLTWEEEPCFRAESDHFIVNVYKRSISRQWAFYIVSKRYKRRVDMTYQDFDGESKAKHAAQKAILKLENGEAKKKK